MNIEEPKQLFEKEFRFLLDKFTIDHLPLNETKGSKEEYVCKPGVYVFWTQDRSVIKVGRHFINSHKRALEHIRDDTGGSMHSLKDDSNARLLLFNVKDVKDLHWVAALEVFFELNLKPEIKSKRLG